MEPLEWAAIISALAAVGGTGVSAYNSFKTNNTIADVNAAALQGQSNTTTMILTIGGLFLAAKWLKVF